MNAVTAVHSIRRTRTRRDKLLSYTGVGKLSTIINDTDSNSIPGKFTAMQQCRKEWVRQTAVEKWMRARAGEAEAPFGALGKRTWF